MANNNQKRYRKQKASVLAALLGIIVVCFSALADDLSSNVWLDVVEITTEARVSVTVPISYGFAVIGSMESGDNIPVSVEDGNLLLPNIRVEVADHTTNSGFYAIQVIGDVNLLVKNYSTDVREGNEEEANPPREGLPVSLEPYFVSNQESIYGNPHYWQPIEIKPTADTDGFKKFRMGLGGYMFSKKEQLAGKEIFIIEQKIALDAPPDVSLNGCTAGGSALIPSATYIPVTVEVGGMQNQYTQVEQSVKVGEIKWNIIPGTLPENP